MFQGVRRIDCNPIEDGAWNKFPADVVNELEQEVDVIIRFGFGLVKGEILSATKHGVISFHPADIRDYRGVSPAWMFLNDDQTATATLQVLSSTIDGGKVVLIDEADTSDVKHLLSTGAECFDYERLCYRSVSTVSTGQISNSGNPKRWVVICRYQSRVRSPLPRVLIKI